MLLRRTFRGRPLPARSTIPVLLPSRNLISSLRLFSTNPARSHALHESTQLLSFPALPLTSAHGKATSSITALRSRVTSARTTAITPIYLYQSSIRSLATAVTNSLAMFVPSKSNPRSPDPNTLANVLDFAVLKTTLDYELSFEKRTLEGAVEHEMECTAEGDGAVTEEIWLDSSYVVVEELSVDGEVFGQLGEKKKEEEEVGVEAGTEVTAEKGWKLEERLKPYGSKLRVVLGRKVEIGEKIGIKVCYFMICRQSIGGWTNIRLILG
ncbi:hypothetical protein EV426DRAFT_273967 [Tirmania nivea]|nr:hypothetical protein EV426DRAFT_273967 [Tirmania nivea]